MFDYVFHLKAQVEMEEAVVWYSKRSQKAALNFVKEIEEKVSGICSNPYQFKNEYKHYYQVGLRKYPFTLVYKILDEKKIVEIIALFHQKRNPARKYKL